MKYLKKFIEVGKGSTWQETKDACDYFGIKNYTINEDGLVDVDGSVNYFLLKTKCDYLFEKLPIKFGRITGAFLIGSNDLTTLEGSPYEVGGSFDCSGNKLTDLIGGPKKVKGSYWCHMNNLTSLEGAPDDIGGDFSCYSNRLKNLVGGPKFTDTYFCYFNELTSLDGAPRQINHNFICNENHDLRDMQGISNMTINKTSIFACESTPFSDIYKLFEEANGHDHYQAFEDFKLSLEIPYAKGDQIDRRLFAGMCKEFGLRIPTKLEHFKFV